MNNPLISVICPTYNEEKFIEKVLEFCVKAIPLDKEIIFVDGGSSDRTIDIIKEYQIKAPGIKLLHNSYKYVPYALNIAIRESKGQYIARIDAHTNYPPDYFKSCLEAIKESGADNVGGYIHSRGEGLVGKAIAYAMSSSFGVGNSSFRTTIKDGFVETVPFGFWPKEVFEKYGLFDEELIRNQDDEFNYRILKKGGKIFQSSKIESHYFVRNSLKSLFRQYFQYGLFKPLVIKKVGKVVKLRHIIPTLFILYLLLTPILIVQFPLGLIPLLVYLFVSIYLSLKNHFSLYRSILLISAFFVLHFSYGLGFLIGLLRKGNKLVK